MSENALRLITGVRARAACLPRCTRACALWRLSSPSFLLTSSFQLVVTVTGYQLYNDANEFYFSHECVPG